jgi:DNA-binding Xre family transcriptional regulator
MYMAEEKRECVVRFRLGEILREREMTQTEASEKTGLSRQAMIKLVRTPQAVQLETLAKLCAGLNISPAELFVVE